MTGLHSSSMPDAGVLGQHVQLGAHRAQIDIKSTGDGRGAASAALGTDVTPLHATLDVAQPAASATVARDIAEQANLAALVARVVYQDEAALAALYRQLSSRVYRQALRLTRQVETAEEVVEDVFWQVWRQAPRFDAARGVVLAWVTQITRSRALDALRAMGRDPLHEALDIDEMHSADTAADTDDPQSLLDRAQVSAQIQRAMAALDPLRRQLVALAFQRGYSQAEIAEETGIPLGTVKSHLRRALATMKMSLELAPRTARHQP
jgi:RNA polymerase sigma factor (sigma-70 family)